MPAFSSVYVGDLPPECRYIACQKRLAHLSSSFSAPLQSRGRPSNQLLVSLSFLTILIGLAFPDAKEHSQERFLFVTTKVEEFSPKTLFPPGQPSGVLLRETLS